MHVSNTHVEISGVVLLYQTHTHTHKTVQMVPGVYPDPLTVAVVQVAG